MLDSANYNAGTVTIAQDVTILAIPGAVGSLVAANFSNAVSVTSGRVVFRNIAFSSNAVNKGVAGVIVTGGAATIEDSSFSNMGNACITAVGNLEINVKDTVFRDSTTGLSLGGGPTVNLSRVHMFGVAQGISAVASSVSPSQTLLHVIDSEIVGADIVAVDAATLNAATLDVVLENTRIYNADTGVRANADTPTALNVTLNGVSITAGNMGVTQGGAAVVKTFGNNNISGNGTDVTGTLTPVAPR